MWGGRFTSSLDPVMEEFNSSLNVDKRMFREDILGSQVYADALQEVGLITGTFSFQVIFREVHRFYIFQNLVELSQNFNLI